jgi:hypothetical protein
MRFLNGFVLIGIILLFISIAGLVKGNTLLTEPGQPVNQFAWLEYLAAAVLMLINGAVSIWMMRRNESQKPPKEPPPETQADSSPDPAPTATSLP